MAATVGLAETNGTSPGTVTNSVANVNMGSTDAYELNPVNFPITAGNNSYQKFNRICCTAKDTSSALKNFRVWGSAPASNTTHKTNIGNAGSYAQKAYATPDATANDTLTPNTMPTSNPGQNNLGCEGDNTVDGQLDITGSLPAFTDYIVMQIRTTGSATAGTTITMNYQYDEVT